jgi:hypothetical protein
MQLTHGFVQAEFIIFDPFLYACAFSLGYETYLLDLFSPAASSRSNTKVSIGTDEREGSYTCPCQEPPAGKASLLFYYQHV